MKWHLHVYHQMRYPHSQLFTLTDEDMAGRVFNACFIGLFRNACLSRRTLEFVIMITKESVRICRCFAVIKYTGGNFLTDSIISRCNRRISFKCLCYQCSDPLYCWIAEVFQSRLTDHGIYLPDLSLLWYNTMPAKDNQNFFIISII